MFFQIAIGLGAGLVAALLYASVALGSFVSVLLFYLAALPIFIAALGWGVATGALAALTATLAVAIAVGGIKAALVFLLTIGLPPLWLSHLALLSRPGAGKTADGEDTLEWYPLGRIVIWAAAMGAALVALMVFIIGGDAQTFTASLKTMLTRFLTEGPPGQAMKDVPRENIESFVAFMVWALPAFTAAIYMMSSLANLWIAAKAVRVSGRLARPEPAYSAIEYPPRFALALAASLVATLLPGIAGLVAGAAAVNFTIAYALAGLAVIHVACRANPLQSMLLTGTYLMIFFFNWIVLIALAAIGFADGFMGLRHRLAARPGATPPD